MFSAQFSMIAWLAWLREFRRIYTYSLAASRFVVQSFQAGPHNADDHHGLKVLKCSGLVSAHHELIYHPGGPQPHSVMKSLCSLTLRTQYLLRLARTNATRCASQQPRHIRRQIGCRALLVATSTLRILARNVKTRLSSGKSHRVLQTD